MTDEIGGVTLDMDDPDFEDKLFKILGEQKWTGLTARLLDHALDMQSTSFEGYDHIDYGKCADVFKEAADHIEKIEAENAELRGVMAWQDIENAIGGMGPKMREVRRAMDSETRLDHIGIRQAAKAIGISPTTYQRVEAGHIPDFKTSKKIMLWVEAGQREVKDAD